MKIWYIIITWLYGSNSHLKKLFSAQKLELEVMGGLFSRINFISKVFFCFKNSEKKIWSQGFPKDQFYTALSSFQTHLSDFFCKLLRQIWQKRSLSEERKKKEQNNQKKIFEFCLEFYWEKFWQDFFLEPFSSFVRFLDKIIFCADRILLWSNVLELLNDNGKYSSFVSLF